jgi:hypothetical protein
MRNLVFLVSERFPMRSFLLAILNLAFVLPSAGTIAACSCPRCAEDEPFLKFVDDLCDWGSGSSARNPYEERIETDRHDFTQSTKTVGCGVVQFEGGYSYFQKNEEVDREKSHTTPELMMRYGITEDIEFRLRWNYAWRFFSERDDVDGAEDLRWAFKLGMTDQATLIPESALEVRFTVPTGGTAWTTERFEFGLDYIYGWELTETVAIYGSTGFGTDALADFGYLPEEPASDRFIAWTQSVAAGWEMSEKNTGYAEFFGVFTDGLLDDVAPVFFNLGIDHYVTDNLVVDLRIGMGLNQDADDFFAGVGGGYRY